MFSSLKINTNTPPVSAKNAHMTQHHQRTVAGQFGVLAAGALIAVSLSVALPLQVQASPQLGEHGVSVNNGPTQLNPSAFVVTKGQKG